MNLRKGSKNWAFEPFLWFALIVGLIAYFVNVLNTHDWLWFQQKSEMLRPGRIIIVDRGQRTTIVPGHEDFERLAEAVGLSVSRPSNSDLINVGISEETVAFYKEAGVMLEIYFDRPVTFHTAYRAGEPTQILLPISGRHAGKGYFFRGAQGEWWFGAMRMADPMPIYRLMAEMGYNVDMPVSEAP